jgi:hypothetical protein
MDNSDSIQKLSKSNTNYYLFCGGIFSTAFALFQLSAIFWPTELVAYFGGPKNMQSTNLFGYAALCILVGIMAATAGLYAISGAGKIRRLPLLRTVLIFVTVIYLLRGLAFISDIIMIRENPDKDLTHFFIFSLIALCIGMIHLTGLIKLLRFKGKKILAHEN